MPVRLQKFLAEAGVASRRACEQIIQDGRVTINNHLVTELGTKIDPGTDRVALDGVPVHRVEQQIYIALHKPSGVVCTSRDSHGCQRALDLLPASLPRLYTVGRLDVDSEGLLLLTNDGNFSLRLTHPRYKRPKSYRVYVDGIWSGKKTLQLLHGVVHDGERLRAEKVTPLAASAGVTELEVVLREGKNRQIRRMMSAVGCRVQRLVRTAIGGLTIENLKQGEWRYLTHEEVRKLLQD